MIYNEPDPADRNERFPPIDIGAHHFAEFDVAANIDYCSHDGDTWPCQTYRAAFPDQPDGTQ